MQTTHLPPRGASQYTLASRISISSSAAASLLTIQCRRGLMEYFLLKVVPRLPGWPHISLFFFRPLLEKSFTLCSSHLLICEMTAMSTFLPQMKKTSWKHLGRETQKVLTSRLTVWSQKPSWLRQPHLSTRLGQTTKSVGRIAAIGQLEPDGQTAGIG